MRNLLHGVAATLRSHFELAMVAKQIATMELFLCCCIFLPRFLLQLKKLLQQHNFPTENASIEKNSINFVTCLEVNIARPAQFSHVRCFNSTNLCYVRCYNSKIKLLLNFYLRRTICYNSKKNVTIFFVLPIKLLLSSIEAIGTSGRKYLLQIKLFAS